MTRKASLQRHKGRSGRNWQRPANNPTNDCLDAAELCSDPSGSRAAESSFFRTRQRRVPPRLRPGYLHQMSINFARCPTHWRSSSRTRARSAVPTDHPEMFGALHVSCIPRPSTPFPGNDHGVMTCVLRFSAWIAAESKKKLNEDH